MDAEENRVAAEERFAEVFAAFGQISAYARRRGCPDPDGIAAETMAIAWRKLADVPSDDPRPWLFATARNLLYADRRARRRLSDTDPAQLEETIAAGSDENGLDPGLDPATGAALQALSPAEREALLLIAWEELTPAEAAESLKIGAVAFRVRLHRARGHFRRLLEERASSPSAPAPAKPTCQLEES